MTVAKKGRKNTRSLGTFNPINIEKQVEYIRQREEEAKRIAINRAKLKSLKPLIECFGLDVIISNQSDYAEIFIKK